MLTNEPRKLGDRLEKVGGQSHKNNVLSVAKIEEMLSEEECGS